MSWIRVVPPDEAEGRLKATYERIRAASGGVDNILQAHGLRPHTLDGHLALYKSVLHHPGNTTPAWLLEAVGVYVSALNGCHYCVAHHRRGLRRHLGDDAEAEAIEAALVADRPEDAFSGGDLLIMRYARTLTMTPAALTRADIDGLRGAGVEDGTILEINQVAAYFAYANRTVLGLGVALEDEG